MRCTLVFYFVATIFVLVYSLPKLCVFKDYRKNRASCGRFDVKYTFDFIPRVSQEISSIDLEGQPLKQLPDNAFRNLSSQNSISKISVRYCQISHVKSGALLNLHNLTDIDLSHNNINQIDSKLFSDTKQIIVIDMAYNKIKIFPNELFQNLLLLEVVYLEHNQIHQVENYSFKNTPSLRKITLHNNQIELMNMIFKDKFDNLTILSLDGNPWRCSCELGPLYEYLIKINHLNQHGLVCEEPPTLQGRNWSDISRDKFVCRSEDAMSTQDSILTSTELMTTTEKDENIPGTVYNGTTYQPVYPGMPQPPSNQNWMLYTILVLGLVCVTVVIIGVVFVVRYTLVTSNRKCHVQLPSIVKRKSGRGTNTRNIDSGLPMHVCQSRAKSENSDSTSHTEEVDEESLPIHHYEIREATIN